MSPTELLVAGALDDLLTERQGGSTDCRLLTPRETAAYDQLLASGPWLLNTDAVGESLTKLRRAHVGRTQRPSMTLCLDVASWIWMHSRPEPPQRPEHDARIATLSGFVAGLVLGAAMVASCLMFVRGCA